MSDHRGPADMTATRRYFGEWTTIANAEETSMTIYISQGRYTPAAIKGMSAKPEDRSEAVAELFAAAGGRLISWYLTLGPYFVRPSVGCRIANATRNECPLLAPLRHADGPRKGLLMGEDRKSPVPDQDDA